MKDLKQKLELAHKMMKFREFYMRLNKEKFLRHVEDTKPFITQTMKKANTDNCLEAMLPLFKKMSENHDDPSYLIAICAELIEREENVKNKI